MGGEGWAAEEGRRGRGGEGGEGGRRGPWSGGAGGDASAAARPCTPTTHTHTRVQGARQAVPTLHRLLAPSGDKLPGTSLWL